MENMTVLALAACVVSAAAVFIFMQFQRYEERQKAADQLLKASADLESVKAKLLGYTKFADYLVPAKQHLADQAKSLAVSVVREVVQLSRLTPDKERIKAEVLLVSRYQVEFVLAIDLKPEGFELLQEGNGISLKTGLPTLTSAPLVRSASHELSQAGVVTDERALFADISQKFSLVAQTQGQAVAREDAVRALCKAKVVDALRDFLSRQAGVRALPMVVLNFR
ncbi:MAG: hypothetical protein KBF66_01355 [Rhodoferax sp.]|uniref:hypothetical protein n=1 Tax=Rhodoferax sp. TaxID=50421 RepID=UPI001B4FB459|nr:hypothetical protein [Rhodoferax sp.]MBP9904173.1 hypothetical protein [Rhodoferax sp.]